MSKHAELRAAIAALEEVFWGKRSAATILTDRRAQLAALGPEPEQPWTAREWKMREAISKAWSAQTIHEAHDALRPIIHNDDCVRQGSEPPQPWTDRERRLREALEAWLRTLASYDEAGNMIISSAERASLIALADAALADIPPPDRLGDAAYRILRAGMDDHWCATTGAPQHDKTEWVAEAEALLASSSPPPDPRIAQLEAEIRRLDCRVAVLNQQIQRAEGGEQ